MDLRLNDCRSVVMNVIETKQENLFNKQCIGNPQYLNSKRRESLQRKLSIQNITEKPKKQCDWKLGKLSKKEKKCSLWQHIY